jgi:hypothetical protein
MYLLSVTNILIYYIYLAIYNFTVVFMRVSKIAMRDYYLHHMCLSVHLSARVSAWNNSARTGRIFMKFYIWEFLDNLSKELKFH